MRIRSIKPEFWSNERLSELPEVTHMFAAALLNYADDEGFFNANPKLIEAALFPLREPSRSIQGMLTELSNIGYVRLGRGQDGRFYGHIVNFTEHQRVNRPSPSKIKALANFSEDSVRTHGGGDEASLPEQGSGNRDQGTGIREDTRERAGPPASSSEPDPPKERKRRRKLEPTPEAARVLERMAELSGCRYGYSSALEARLRQGATVEQCIAVVEHLARDPWWLERRFASAEAPFRVDKWPSYLAQAEAAAQGPPRRRPKGQAVAAPPVEPPNPAPPEGYRSGGLCRCGTSAGWVIRRGRRVWDTHDCVSPEQRRRWGIWIEGDVDFEEAQHATG